MPSILQFPHGSCSLRKLLLTPALSSVLLTSFAAPLPAGQSRWAPLWPAHGQATPPKNPTTPRVAGGPVSGQVLDAKGQGLPGVTVLVAGTTLGGATNSDGTFVIENVPAGAHTLIISSVGLVTARVPITVAEGQPTRVAATTLAEDTQALSEVVVVGYGTQNRQELTTAISSVGGQALARQTVAGFDQALQGQVAGVQVTAPSGAPGSGINVRIRGNNSFSLTNSPLYVIDGIPVLPTYDQEVGVGNQKPNPLNTINPSDIESIDVLKDAAAAAIYGLRASNGVVVITTKRGKAGKPEISLSAYVGTQELRKKIDLLNSSQFAQYFNEAQLAGGRDITNPTQGFPDLNNLPPYNTDWQDAIYRKAGQQNYQLAMRGGSDKTKYYVSGGYFKQNGIILNSDFDRFTFKLNLDQQMTDRFRIGTSLNLSRTNNNNSVRSELGLGNSGVVAGALAYIPTVPVRTADGRYSTNPFTLLDNPVGNLLETRNKSNITQVIGSVYGELDVLKNLTLRSQVGIDYRDQIENQFITRDYPGTSSSANRGSARTGTNQQTIWLVENTLTYRPGLGDRHDLTLLLGQSAQASDRFTSGASVTNFSSNAVPYLTGGTVYNAPSSFQDQWGLLSFFGRAIYNYDQRYLFTASLRADGASRFAPGNKFGYFPAVSAGWRVSKETFFPQEGVVSDLKVRASYGAVGNSEIAPYDRFTLYNVGSNYASTGGIAGGIAPGRVGNPDVKWESTYQLNAGIDLGLIKDRVVLTFDAYRKRTSDLLTQVPLPTSTGINPLQVIGNIGEIENKGIELGLNTTNVRNPDGFTWTTNFNISFNRNKVIDLGTLRNDQGLEVDRQTIYTYSILQKGQPLSAFYGYKVQSIFQSADEITKAPTQPNSPKPGDIRFVDVNSDGKIDASDRTIIGNPNPKFTGGITNTLAYKGIELSFFFQSSYGNDIYNQNRQTIEGMNGPYNQTTAVLNRWTPTNTNTNIPRAVTGDPNGNASRVSDRFIEDGSYLRLKNLTLGYTLPSGLLQPAHISNIRVYVTGQNLITWTKYSGYDPEVSADPFSSTAFGRDLGVYPQARTYTVGLNASF
jgi:TonB-linked SusC/RagA family outer membrane protein